MDQINDLEQSLLAAVRRAHDEFAQNGFDGMAITMIQAEREVRELASRARFRTASLRKLSNEVLASLPLMEPLARREFGNTNYNLLIQRAEEARQLSQ